ncbi:MAG: hypothetical protein HYR56_01730 [Acidobacteria bacterium]|nr:hypothetical protein [Acidobacteriota bacterium]MBI3424524.1 hypothetical protein [Acidobacteriota bacterium]
MKRLALCLLCTCAWHLTVSAHVLDQYLQVAQIALAPDGVRIELRLIPGAQVAERVFVLMDADGDGQISAAEEQAYAQRVLQDLSLSINEQHVPLTLAEAQFPTRATMNEGLGTLRLTFTAATALSSTGNQRLNFRNDHVPEFSGYLVNALVPAAREIAITGQQRDVLQRGLRLDYRVTPAASSLARRWLMLSALALGLVLLLSRWRIFATGRA